MPDPFAEYYTDCRNSWAQDTGASVPPNDTGVLWLTSSDPIQRHAYLHVSRATFQDILHRLASPGRERCLFEYASGQYEINFGWVALRLDPYETNPDDNPMFLVEEPITPREG